MNHWKIYGAPFDVIHKFWIDKYVQGSKFGRVSVCIGLEARKWRNGTSCCGVFQGFWFAPKMKTHFVKERGKGNVSITMLAPFFSCIAVISTSISDLILYQELTVHFEYYWVFIN